MTTLGEILDQLHDRSELYQILAASGNVPLIAKLDQLAHETDGDQCGVALRAVHAFTRKADDQSWVKLIGCVQDSKSPAGACLSEMITWSLTH
jgi:hypothetical protein